MSSAPNPTENVEINTLNRLIETIEDVKNGLDVDVIASWYSVIESQTRAICPTQELRDSVYVVQNQLLPMKFEFKMSKRAIPYVIDIIESNLNAMPFATRLYFQKFEEILQKEQSSYLAKTV
ncbi:MAG: hypothetical protein JRN20_10250 [Nitrososphaerota archaeon]|jgi:hypothetical protein|nr:hypothetical protein [Nitrososphaerota archaeon]MDG6922576.1 hypothetical protein [Nitrososphaerota archaeon]